jgi:adenine-specific DNA-methyltransferase
MEKVTGKTVNIVEENISKLKEIFPEIFNEDKVDLEKLGELLGDYKENNSERYNFTWPGKSKAVRIAQTPSTGTLRPCKKESKNWEDTENLYIEGDNLEVLKLLQKSYNGKVKMIYIDPPYNTGNDFVYKDDFKDNVENYLAVSGQKDSEGYRVTTNTEANGRYHSNWLNMMYPRLKLARNLLKDDGVIFISIDDNEVENLKKISNEIFGEDNFVGTITWEKRTKAQNTIDARDMFQSKTEYIIIYKKSISKIRFNLETAGTKEYDERDKKGEFRYKIVEEMSSLGIRGRTTMIYPILGIMPGVHKQWKVGIETVTKFIEREDLVLIDNRPYFKIRPLDEDAQKYFPFWSHFFDKDTYGVAEVGKSELSEILGTKAHDFETVKPISLIKKLIFHVKDMINKKSIENDIILDFFSGSSTTAHSVMQLNAEDRGNRRFIMVQIPEVKDKKSEAYKAGYKNICEIGKERIRRAGEKIKEENKSKEGIEDLDIGFKVFKLDSSNINKWDSNFNKDLETNLLSSIENIKKDRTEEDVLYEILLKYGIDLNMPIDEELIKGKKVFSIGFGAILACLDDEITLDVVEGIGKLKEKLQPETCRVVFMDNGFDTDSVKTNAIQILKRYDIEDVKSI